MEKYPEKTYENFFEAVKASFKRSEPKLSEQEVNRFSKSEPKRYKEITK